MLQVISYILEKESAANIPNMRAVKIRDIQRLLEQQGFTPKRQTGAHVIYSKPGWRLSPVVDLDRRGTLPSGTVTNIARAMGLSLPQFAQLLGQMKGNQGL